MIWSLEQGLELVRLLQPETRRFGYHLTLGGGVLNTGASDKDLDLFFLPMDNIRSNPEPDKLLEFLRSLWGNEEQFRPRIPMNQYSVVPDGRGGGRLSIHTDVPYEQPLSSPYKHKVKFFYGGGTQRVDVFIIDIKRDPTGQLLTETNECASSS